MVKSLLGTDVQGLMQSRQKCFQAGGRVRNRESVRVEARFEDWAAMFGECGGAL